MDSVIAKALEKRDELQRELREIDRFLTMYARFKGDQPQAELPGLQERSREEQIEPEVGMKLEQDSEAEPLETVSATRLNRMQLRPHITAILEQAGQPLTRGRLLQKLDQRGIEVGGTYDRSKNMGTIMWRLRDDFVNLPGRGYWPRHLAFKPGGYDPTEGGPDTVEPDFAESQD